MAELKTKKNNASVAKFLENVENEGKREDSFKLLEIFKDVTDEEPSMWGDSIVGYGTYHYKSERSSQEGDWPLTGFSPRKANLTIYIMPGFDKFQDDLAELGKHKTSVSCLYIKKLSDIDIKVLKRIIKNSVQIMRKQQINNND